MSYVAALLSAMLVAWVLVGLFALRSFESDIKLRDGRTVHCLVNTTMYARSLSCDWNHARRAKP